MWTPVGRVVLFGVADKLFSGESFFGRCSAHCFCHIYLSLMVLIVERVCPQLYKGSFESSHDFLTHIFYVSLYITNVFLNVVFMLLSTLCPFVYKVFRIQGFGCTQIKLCTATISSSGLCQTLIASCKGSYRW